jgi:hypothetical protein
MMNFQAVESPKPSRSLKVGRWVPGTPLEAEPNHVPDFVSLLCPVCGHNFVHIEKREDSYREKDSIHFYPIVFWGECGHRWRLIFHFHKGQMSIWTERLPDLPGEELPDAEPIW